MSVDDAQPPTVVQRSVDPLPDDLAGQLWLGCVVPKRNARRSVTRALLKRQIRVAFGSAAATGLASGLWVVRLRAPFDPKKFPSAASDALRVAVRLELQELIAKLLRRQGAQSAAEALAS